MEKSDRKFWLSLMALFAVYLLSTLGVIYSMDRVLDLAAFALSLLLSWLAWSREKDEQVPRIFFVSLGFSAVALSALSLILPGYRLGMLALMVLSAGMAIYISFRFVRRSARNG